VASFETGDDGGVVIIAPRDESGRSRQKETVIAVLPAQSPQQDRTPVKLSSLAGPRPGSGDDETTIDECPGARDAPERAT